MTNTSRIDRGELLISLGLAALGAYLLFHVRQIANVSGYEQLGPRLFPILIGVSLVIFGLALGWQAIAGGWRNLPEDNERGRADWLAFVVIGAGLVLHMILIGVIGFVAASTLLFVFAARGFGSRRWLRDTAIGFVLAVAAFYLFTLGLQLKLPASPLGVF